MYEITSTLLDLGKTASFLFSERAMKLHLRRCLYAAVQLDLFLVLLKSLKTAQTTTVLFHNYSPLNSKWCNRVVWPSGWGQSWELKDCLGSAWWLTLKKVKGLKVKFLLNLKFSRNVIGYKTQSALVWSWLAVLFRRSFDRSVWFVWGVNVVNSSSVSSTGHWVDGRRWFEVALSFSFSLVCYGRRSASLSFIFLFFCSSSFLLNCLLIPSSGCWPHPT